MKRSNIVCALCGLLAPALAGATPLPYYVSANGTAHAEAGDPIAPATDDHPYSTGPLMQTTAASGSEVAGTQAAYQIGQFFELTTAKASANSSAQIGALHAYAASNSDTGLLNPPGVIFSPGEAKGQSSAMATWSDTLHFRTYNPNGSDFVWSLSLDDSISSGGSFYATESGFFASLAEVNLAFTNDDLGPINGMDINDRHTVFSSGTILDAPAAQDVQSITFHAQPAVEYFATLTCTLNVFGNAINGTGQATADASDTSLFSIYSADPLASYNTASGIVFPTSVPEPASLALVGCGTVGLMLCRQRRRA